MNRDEKQNIVELLCSSQPESIALAEAICDSQNFPLETILREFGYLDVGIKRAADFTKTEINCIGKGLKKLPDLLPASLKDLFCENNQLTVLPNLPASLEWLNCNDNQLTVLPNLPASLEWLNCQNNHLNLTIDQIKALAPKNCYIYCDTLDEIVAKKLI